jgi:hypothetical protein
MRERCTKAARPRGIPRGSRRRAVAAAAVALISLAALGASQVRPAFSQTAPSALSPEEAIISLRPFALTANDLPSGYRLAGTSAGTPASQAFVTSSPRAALRERDAAGYMVSVSQTLLPLTRGAGPVEQFGVALFADAPSAAAYATGVSFPIRNATGQQVEAVDLPAPVGSASKAWHLTVSPPDERPIGEYLIRWHRGQVAFTVVTAAVSGDEKLADAAALVAVVDLKEAALPAPKVGLPTVTPAATEAQRLTAAELLATIGIGDEDAPIGYNVTNASIATNAGIVFGNPDPQATLHRVDEQWKRIVGVTETFSTPQGSSSTTLVAEAVLDADAASANVNMRDLIAAPTAVVTVIDPPVQLGDAGYAFTFDTTSASGEARQSVIIEWTHGPLLLAVTMSGPQAMINMDDLVDFAQQWETAYQASDLAPTGSTLPSPPPAASPNLTPSPLPTPAPTPITTAGTVRPVSAPRLMYTRPDQAGVLGSGPSVSR